MLCVTTRPSRSTVIVTGPKLWITVTGWPFIDGTRSAMPGARSEATSRPAREGTGPRHLFPTDTLGFVVYRRHGAQIADTRLGAIARRLLRTPRRAVRGGARTCTGGCGRVDPARAPCRPLAGLPGVSWRGIAWRMHAAAPCGRRRSSSAARRLQAARWSARAGHGPRVQRVNHVSGPRPAAPGARPSPTTRSPRQVGRGPAANPQSRSSFAQLQFQDLTLRRLDRHGQRAPPIGQGSASLRIAEVAFDLETTQRLSQPLDRGRPNRKFWPRLGQWWEEGHGLARFRARRRACQALADRSATGGSSGGSRSRGCRLRP